MAFMSTIFTVRVACMVPSYIFRPIFYFLMSCCILSVMECHTRLDKILLLHVHTNSQYKKVKFDRSKQNTVVKYTYSNDSTSLIIHKKVL